MDAAGLCLAYPSVCMCWDVVKAGLLYNSEPHTVAVGLGTVIAAPLSHSKVLTDKTLQLGKNPPMLGNAVACLFTVTPPWVQGSLCSTLNAVARRNFLN